MHDPATHLIPGRNPVREALRAGRELTRIHLAAGSAEQVADIVTAAQGAGVDLVMTDRPSLDALLQGVAHQGVVAEAPAFAYGDVDLLASADLVVMLDSVTDPRNLGAVARAAEQAGAAGLVVRSRRAATVTPAAEKAAAGALSWLPIVRVANLDHALRGLKDAGMWAVGLAGAGGTVLWQEPLLDERVVLLVGSEGKGLSHLIQQRSDALVTIPMRGRLDSLNAATATAIALFEWTRRRS